jgi:hypothetical protein
MFSNQRGISDLKGERGGVEVSGMNWEISESRDMKFIDEWLKAGTFHGSMQVRLLVDRYVSELRPKNTL